MTKKWISGRMFGSALALCAITCTLTLLPASGVHASESEAVPVTASLPGKSLYQLPIKLTDQDGRIFSLTDQRGKPVIISMFYNACQFVCPMLIDTLEYTLAALTSEQRARASILLVTIDPARDSVEVLKGIATKRQLNPAQWTLARTDEASVRKLAALLGIQYRLLENGDYNHSTVLILLDAEGRIAGSTSDIGKVDPEFLKLLQNTVN